MLKASPMLSPAEAARRLGVSTKALRLYEARGLVRPLRSALGWRAYGPAEMARLHQVLALKHLGLPLARIAALLGRTQDTLSTVLALQEQALTREQAQLTRALALVRAARAELAAGRSLSLDDLTRLTKETTMTASSDDMKALFNPLISKHFSAEDRDALAARPFDQAAVTRQWEAVIADAKDAMALGDPGTPAALDAARRWKALLGQFTAGDTGLAAKAGAVWGEAMADKAAAPGLPLTPDLFAFMGKALAKLNESGG
jgi:DNA-binding transcriptional MerR regulator